MKKTSKTILREYEEGRITSTAFVIELLNSLTYEQLKDALESLPANLTDELRDFVEDYRPGMRVFRGSAPTPLAVKLARELLNKTVRST